VSIDALNKLLISALIILLHVPLIVFAVSLYASLQHGQGVGDLSFLSILVLILLMFLPYALLAAVGVKWNPARSRLDAPDC
jgi:hypothetical protein